MLVEAFDEEMDGQISIRIWDAHSLWATMDHCLKHFFRCAAESCVMDWKIVNRIAPV
jgi:hypothetical protein